MYVCGIVRRCMNFCGVHMEEEEQTKPIFTGVEESLWKVENISYESFNLFSSLLPPTQLYFFIYF